MARHRKGTIIRHVWKLSLFEILVKGSWLPNDILMTNDIQTTLALGRLDVLMQQGSLIRDSVGFQKRRPSGIQDGRIIRDLGMEDNSKFYFEDSSFRKISSEAKIVWI